MRIPTPKHFGEQKHAIQSSQLLLEDKQKRAIILL